MTSAPIRCSTGDTSMGDEHGIDPFMDLLPLSANAGAAEMAQRIGILIFDGFSLVEVSSIAEIFRLANEMEAEHAGEAESYALVVLSSTGGSVASSCSMRIWSESLDAPLLSEKDAAAPLLKDIPAQRLTFASPKVARQATAFLDAA